MKTLIQEHPQLGLDGGTIASGCVGCIDHRYKRMDYSYDLISGNVKRVDYQKDQPDRFHHSYTYDADNTSGCGMPATERKARCWRRSTTTTSSTG